MATESAESTQRRCQVMEAQSDIPRLHADQKNRMSVVINSSVSKSNVSYTERKDSKVPEP